MAAVIASLAAFLAGCGLPALPLGVTRDSNQGRDLCSEDRTSRVVSQEGASSAVWQSACQAARASPVAAVDTCSTLAVTAKAVPAQLEDSPHTGGVLQKHTKRGEPPRRVSFNLGASTTHEITPYSEVYGIHPRDFHFGRSAMEMVAKRKPKRHYTDFNDSDDDYDDEDLGGLQAKALDLFTKGGIVDASRALTRPWWVAMGAICIMLQLFGTQVCVELLGEALSVPTEAWSGILQKAV